MKNLNPSNAPLETRAVLYDRRERITFVILRNAIPLIGILFLGWSAQNLIVLYFVDTLGAMWALITGLALNMPEAKIPTNFWGRVSVWATMLFVGAFLVAFLAIPLGMPLFIYALATDWDWGAALNDEGFVWGLISIAILSFVGMLRYYQMIDKLTPDGSNAKRDFGILMTRWVIVLILIYAVGFLLGEWGAYVMVLGYIVATVVSEIYPDRFANMFGQADKKRRR